MLAVLRPLGITFEELGRRGREAALDSLVAEGFSREEASSELGHRGRRGALASLERQGFTGEGGTLTASEELASRGGNAYSAIYRESGNCSYPGCTYALNSSGFCKHHRPKKPEKSDKCRVFGQVFKGKERVTGGACMPCYQKPDMFDTGM